MATRVLQISPMIPSRDPDATAAFFRDVLGFDHQDYGGGYHICSRDSHSVHIQRMGDSGVGEMSLYIAVDQIDELWSGMEGQVQDLRHRAPFDQPYGMREAHIEVPATNALLFLGQSLG